MWRKLKVLPEYFLPTRTLEFFSAKIANSRNKYLKTFLIKRFIRKHHIDLTHIKNPRIDEYPSFNSFFTREIKKTSMGKSSTKEIASPAEGMVTQLGTIKENILIQAKKQEFTLENLLSNTKNYIKKFENGEFITFFLDAYNYHRFHMPITGNLEYSIYIPSGHNFELDPDSQKEISQLYCRNERYIAFFNTEVGTLGIVLIGALYVGGIQMAWMHEPIKQSKIIRQKHHSITLKKEEELGLFQYGSAIILLFEKDRIKFKTHLKNKVRVLVNEAIANIQFKETK